MEVWQRIRHLHATGWSVRGIPRELGLSRITVRKAHRDLRAMVAHHNDLPPGYAQTGVRNVRELLAREPEDDGDGGSDDEQS